MTGFARKQTASITIQKRVKLLSNKVNEYVIAYSQTNPFYETDLFDTNVCFLLPGTGGALFERVIQ